MHRANRHFLLVLSLIFSHQIWAQSNLFSPYSISGFGQFKPKSFIEHRTMGGVSRAIQDQHSFTYINPASYSSLNFTSYQAGMSTIVGRLSTTDQEAYTTAGNINYFSMGFGLPEDSKHDFGFSMGFHELSEIGYDITNDAAIDTPEYYDLFRGSGGLSTAYAGFGMSPLKNLTVGANINFNFGNTKHILAKVYPNTSDYNSFSDETYFYYTGFNYDIGVQYSIQDSVGSNILHHTFGATLQTSAKLKGRGYRYAETFLGIPYSQGQLLTVDTLIFDENLNNTRSLPAVIGLAYAIGKTNKWAISAEYELSKWSAITSADNNKAFFDNKTFALGGFINPSHDFQNAGEYLKKIRYSLGVNYSQLYYNFFDKQINEIGIGIGLGLPVTKTLRLTEGKISIISRINLGFEYIQRGTTENNLIKEDYYKISLGLNFNDKWFIKRKFH